MIEMLIILCGSHVEENHTKKYNNEILLNLLNFMIMLQKMNWLPNDSLKITKELTKLLVTHWRNDVANPCLYWKDSWNSIPDLTKIFNESRIATLGRVK